MEPPPHPTSPPPWSGLVTNQDHFVKAQVTVTTLIPRQSAGHSSQPREGEQEAEREEGREGGIKGWWWWGGGVSQTGATVQTNGPKNSVLISNWFAARLKPIPLNDWREGGWEDECEPENRDKTRERRKTMQAKWRNEQEKDWEKREGDRKEPHWL